MAQTKTDTDLFYSEHYSWRHNDEVRGKVMASKRVGVGQTQINDQPLPTGIYIVSLLKDGRVVESEKYLVQ